MRRPASARDFWDSHAATYDRMMDRMDRLMVGDSRATVCGRARGRTLEVAIGTGRNLTAYPPDVELTGVDLSPAMLAVARARVAATRRVAELLEGDAMRLPFGDEEFDTVVCTLGLCSVPDVDGALAEMWRVLQPDGRLLLLDHVRPMFAPLRWLLRLAEGATRVLQPHSGEHFLRRPFEHLSANGFAVEESRRFNGGAVEWVVARRTSGPAPA